MIKPWPNVLQRLASQLLQLGEDDLARLRQGFVLATCRDAEAEELEELRRLLESYPAEDPKRPGRRSPMCC